MPERTRNYWKSWIIFVLTIGVCVAGFLIEDPYVKGIIIGIALSLLAYNAWDIRSHYKKPLSPEARLERILEGSSNEEALSTLVEALIGSILNRVPVLEEFGDQKIGVVSLNWILPRHEPFDVPLLVTVEARPMAEPKASELN